MQACPQRQFLNTNAENAPMSTVKIDENKLNDYLAADTKYQIVPVPTGIERDAVVSFVRRNVTPLPSHHTMGKLARLARLYNARACAESFASALRSSEQYPADFVRSALAVSAIGWLGDARQLHAAQDYYHGLLKRVQDEELRQPLADAAFFLGPEEPPTPLLRWAEERRA